MDKVKVLIIAAIVCIVVGLVVALSHCQSVINTMQSELTTTQGALKTASNTIQQMKERNAELSKLDKRYHDEIKAIRYDIADLRIGIDNGTIRLRVNAVPMRTDSNSGTSSSIDGASCRLTPDAESAYLSLREQLKEKDAKITALQGYIKTQCLRKE